MRRGIIGTAAAVWLAILAASLVERLPAIATQAPRILAGPVERAEIRSGDTPYHQFLGRVADVVPKTEHLLLLVHDPSQSFAFFTYRAAYMLYPVPHRFVPSPAPLPAGPRFNLDVDEQIAGAVRDERITYAAVYATKPVPGGRVFRILLKGPRRLSFQEETGPTVPSARRTGVFGATSPWCWPLGLVLLVWFGWMLLDVLGLSAHVRGSVSTRIALAWLAGAGSTAFWMLLIGLTGARWSLPVILLPWVLVAAVWGWRLWRARAVPPPADAGTGTVGVSAAAETLRPPPVADPVTEPSWLAPAGWVLIGATTLLAAVQVLIPMSAWGNWDAWAIWNLKTRAFWTAGSLPVSYLLDFRYDFSHPDYPPGIALIQTWLGLWAGGLSETLLRALSPVWHLALMVLLAGLGRELGLRGERWLVAGAYGLMPRIFEQAHNGYSDLALAAAVTGVLLFLVRASRGDAPPWTVALFLGIAGLIKGEALVLAGGCGALIGLWWLLKRIRFGQAAAAWGLMLVLLVPWRATVASLHIKSTFEVKPARIAAQAPLYFPYVVKAAFVDALGPELTVDHLRDIGDINPADWLWRQRRNWAGFWYVVVTALVLYGFPGLVRPAGAMMAALLALQLAVTWAVTLGAQYQIIWVLVTSVDRMLLQLSPLGFALAAACVGSVGLRPPPPAPLPPPSKGRKKG
ncbi:MAG: hypothetical protein AAB152_05785 [Candidatus Coatesbacteria bacterium]